MNTKTWQLAHSYLVKRRRFEEVQSGLDRSGDLSTEPEHVNE